MEQVATIEGVRALLCALPRPLAFVPTMGALHAGHLELVRHARSARSLVVSIFVNPLQFGPNEDLARYPRDLRSDREKLTAAGVDVLFTPETQTMYGRDFVTSVDPGPLGTVYEGAVRPGHFRGVATVIAKLLNIVRPDVLMLGQKDAQQAVVVRTMLRDLDFATSLEIVPTVRESDGLAMSSRNAYLNAEQRAAAPALYRALLALRSALENGNDKDRALSEVRRALVQAGKLDYLDVVDAADFSPLPRLRPPAFIIGAARFGPTRLIDNLWVQ